MVNVTYSVIGRFGFVLSGTYDDAVNFVSAQSNPEVYIIVPDPQDASYNELIQKEFEKNA